MPTTDSTADISILYVEDETATREQVSKALELQGLQVITARNGQEGVECYRKHAPDIILTDIMMPIMNGLEMSREIRDIAPDAQIICMTAFSDISYTIEAIDIGISQFVVKPVEFKRLFAAIDHCRKTIELQRQLLRQTDHIRLLSNALEQSAGMAMITDKQGVIEYVNRKFCLVTGYAPEEVMGKTPSMMKSGETSNETYQDLWTTILSGREWHGAFLNRAKNGERFWEYASISPLKSPDGSILKFIKTAEDITERRKLEAEIIRAKKLEAVGILAGGMAHDFNNLLQVILGYVSLARMNADPESKVADMLGIAETTSEAARDLSKRLLSLAHAGESTMLPVQVGPLIETTVDTELARSGITRNYDYSPDLPPIVADSSQIQQVFSQLAINAREAMPPGAGAVTVTIRHLQSCGQEIPTLPPGEYLHITFHDNGHGISAGNLPRIFDPYFTTKEMGSRKGTGLGLTVCHSIIGHHHGSIFAESSPGNGTIMHIYLPVAPQQPD